ncbi:MAG: adenosine deaminase [Spirochaetaceae bacterium]|nr:adenosine deaminase [Spirochaetaceae bacterium]
MSKLTHEQLIKFPKIELHRHLEGCFYPPVLFYLAKKNKLDFPSDYTAFVKELQFPQDSAPDFHLFLSKFINSWYKSLDDVADVVYGSVSHIDTGDNLAYLELRFNPYHYAARNNFEVTDTLKVVLQAAQAAAAKLPFKVRYLLTFNRMQFKDNEMLEIFKKFEKYNNLDEIVGIDLAGDEVNFPPELFPNFFDYVHQAGYKATIHAGEVSSAAQIWTAIDTLHAGRIGHGVRCIDDERLQEVMKERNIALEQCLVSNYQTNAWADYASHPLRKLFDKGLPVTLNSDDPTVQGKTLNDDYILASEKLNFTREEFIKLNLNAIEASFLPADEKAELKVKYLNDCE